VKKTTDQNWLLQLAAKTARIFPAPVKKVLYRLGPLTQGLRTALNRAAPHGLAVVKIAAGELAGFFMELDLQQEKDYWLGTYEPELQAAVRDWVQPGWTAYDLGANIGFVSLLLGRAVGPQGYVLAVEALPGNVNRLTRNVELNELGGIVEVLPAAVTNQDGPVTFLVGPSGGMGKADGSAGRELDYEERITVPGISLDAQVYASGRAAPQVIKIDIEGGEVLALPGMQRVLREARPILFIELHGEQAASLVWHTLQDLNYTIHQMTGGYPVVPHLDDLDWKSYLVAVPEKAGR
jgi:FkbM family methyltransferase